MSALPWIFDSLSPREKRIAVENATGLTWAQYSAMDQDQRTAILLSLKGLTYQSGTDDMYDAAKSDSFWSVVQGWFSGMGAGLKIALLLGIVVVAYVSLPKLGKARQAARRAA